MEKAPNIPATGHAIRNINEVYSNQLTKGQRIADYVAKTVGSWPFIILQTGIIFLWMGFNVYLVYMRATNPGYFDAWDPYPFILLNLVLSFQAAYTGPVVMMSQNRQAEKDRLMAEHDYHVNIKAEHEIKEIIKSLRVQEEALTQILNRLDAGGKINEEGLVSPKQRLP